MPARRNRPDKRRMTPTPAGPRAAVTTHTVDGDAFLDPAEQFRYEVYLAWARRIPKADKPSLPLAPYRIGPRFLASIEAASADRAKVVDVVVEVLTGLAASLDSRELHVLRAGEGATARAQTRDDGATCWRVALQRAAPSARRLHFWRSGADIELSRVVLHDDFAP